MISTVAPGHAVENLVAIAPHHMYELQNAGESEAIAPDRAARRQWLEARGYKVCQLDAGRIERDLASQLDPLAGV
jgi:tRNA/rRNA methyltransferase